ncbi:MAG TPA: SAM-dependent methyltransferase [Terriglobales bacterium]|nr:SAM-dependent methyltransferase [Terriglobales bacterium]
MTAREVIEQEIRCRGPIPFSRYMELCLYHPEVGYYLRGKEQFGKAGDFYTASDVHAVFGRLLARQFEEMWRLLGSPSRLEIVELGPGRGLFARDVMDWSRRKFPEFYDALRYVLVEISPTLRAALAERLKEYVEAGKVSIATELEVRDARLSGENVITFANEFFDALPVEVLSHRGALRIGLQEGRLVEAFAPPSTQELEFLDRYSVHPQPGERVEASLGALAWMRRIAAAMPRGFVILIDYGYTREEQLAGRHLGTIMAYRQHAASPNPYEAPGEQDITTHVNFTALRATGESAGLETQGLITQSQFLMGIGEPNQFADAFDDSALPQDRAKVALQLKHLVTPAGMGENFRVLLMSKGVSKEKAARVSGLNFLR